MRKLSTREMERHDQESFKDAKRFPLILLLDNIRSGLNVGSIFRTADAFACEKVILCGITAQPPHREILKTALGSTETVNWEYSESATEAVDKLKLEGHSVFCIEQGVPRIWLQEFDPSEEQKVVLILGNEVNGVSEELLPLCDGMIEIPQFGTKHSLNVSVAAGIAVWETIQRFQ